MIAIMLSATFNPFAAIRARLHPRTLPDVTATRSDEGPPPACVVGYHYVLGVGCVKNGFLRAAPEPAPWWVYAALVGVAAASTGGLWYVVKNR